MHHPGPPRFVATGDEVELAPRDPDPSATYTWRLTRAPVRSTASLGDDPVEHLVPDAPGRYVVRLSAPDGEHDLTVRAFPGDLHSSGGYTSGRSGGRSGGVSGGQSGPGRSGSGEYTQAGDDTGGGGRPRLSLRPAIEGDEAVVRADCSSHPEGSETAADLAVEFLLDDRDDIDKDAVTREGATLRIPLDALPERARIHGVAVGEYGYSVPDAVEFTRTADGVETVASGAGVAARRPYVAPSWAEDSTIYEIYVRTFAGDSDESPFDAIIDRLDYLDSLGVDVIWLTPVLQNDHAPHGYNITDFFEIASDLGTRADYERFVEAAHDRGFKVLFDLVCNHSARTHPYFESAVDNPESEYRDWYAWRSDTEPETYFEWEHIANFDFDHLPVRRHLLDAVAQWAELVDGFRCDMAWAVPNGFWREIHDYCKDRDSEFLLLDETIPYIPDFQAGLFDMHFDSTTYAALRQVGGGSDAEAVLDAIEGRAEIGFPDHASFMLYAENHDETRYIVDYGREAAEAAAGALFTLPGAPLLYAGQEFGQRGRRDDLAWDHADETLQSFVGDLSAVRHDQPALSAEADLVRIPYEVRDGPSDRVVAYARTTEDDAAVVVLNFGSEPTTVGLPIETDETDLVSGDHRGAGGDSDGTAVTVDSVAVFPAGSSDLRQ
ncbi:alpha-amylase family glycosyl hydrolase [Haloarcula sp. S1AR25-5A]|uniref:Alpha-amylase family glycosyl hydrolase n=1 Tax=Haloarcula terrestris TaxID=2950533 RepID=A0AAE4JHY7_9EURY|nr:alpha-amylase MalA [Haloarcula terrestris]MDS0220581.1 alpha-amylase family glycosyl hydrolase [Haloarcula terrestris]